MVQVSLLSSQHWFGEAGKRYLQWLVSTKKMAMIFEFDIDSHYYRGVSDNSYGKKYNKSYVETFIYQEPEKIKDISPENDAVYLIKSQDKGIFDEDYRCYSYGEFCVEVPKWKE